MFGLACAVPSSAQAGVLNGHVDAFDGIAGTIPFDNGVGLSGTIDFAVFTAGDFGTNFAGLGYDPGPGLVYTYQLFVTGSLGVSAEFVGIGNPANTIGTFDIGDVNASMVSFTPDARWLFSPEVLPGQSSWGLAFSSPNLPIVGISTTIGGETQAMVAGLAIPGHIAVTVPEPSSLLLVALGLAACRFARRTSTSPGMQ